jgi:hypothetical protein
VEKYRNPHGQLKENLFLPLFNTNFISKSFGGPLHNSSQLPIWQLAGKGTRHFNPLWGLQIFPPLVQRGYNVVIMREVNLFLCSVIYISFKAKRLLSLRLGRRRRSSEWERTGLNEQISSLWHFNKSENGI